MGNDAKGRDSENSETLRAARDSVRALCALDPRCVRRAPEVLSLVSDALFLLF